MRDWTVLCVITGAHGVSGRVKIKPYTEEPENILAYGELTDDSGTLYPLDITGMAKGQLLCSIDGVTDRNAAEKLRGTKLGVPSDRLPEPEEGSFYIEDLVGLRVCTSEGEDVGKVKAVHNFGAGDMVEIQPPSGKTELFAFTDANFPEVDIAAGTLTFCAPERIIVKEETSQSS